MNEIKRYEIHLSHDDRAVFVEKLKVLLCAFPEVHQQCREQKVNPLLEQLRRLLASKALPEYWNDEIRTTLAAVEQGMEALP